jgi:alcohol dehydrogenase class IV
VFPTSLAVEEGAEMVRRTGSKSIISIGNGSISDVAKGIRALYENGVKSVDDLDRCLHLNSALNSAVNPSDTLASSSPTRLANKVVLPHLAVSTTLSFVPLMPRWVSLHHEEDVFISRECSEPQVLLLASIPLVMT